MSEEANGKVWLVTGGNRGLGKAIAEAALDAGDSVVVGARDAAAAAEVFSEAGERCFVVPLDVTDREAIAAAVESALDRFGTIDVLVNNAGYGQLGFFEEVGREQVLDQFDVNLFGLMDVTRAVLPVMREKGRGQLFQISSAAGYGTDAGGSIYAASKFALVGFTVGLAQELAPLGIHATIVAPGFFRTDFLDPSSARFRSRRIDAYSEMADLGEAFAEERNHSQIGDPAALGRLLVKVADSEDPPLHLPVGEDSYEYVRGTYQGVLEEIGRWEPEAVATAYPPE